MGTFFQESFATTVHYSLFFFFFDRLSVSHSVPTLRQSLLLADQSELCRSGKVL